jgi:hypothetical protein
MFFLRTKISMVGCFYWEKKVFVFKVYINRCREWFILYRPFYFCVIFYTIKEFFFIESQLSLLVKYLMKKREEKNLTAINMSIDFFFVRFFLFFFFWSCYRKTNDVIWAPHVYTKVSFLFYLLARNAIYYTKYIHQR